MRISFSLLFILVLFTACGPGKGRIRIEGKLKHLDKAECYLYAEGGDFSKPDTITISGGKFKLEKELPEACLLTSSTLTLRPRPSSANPAPRSKSTEMQGA